MPSGNSEIKRSAQGENLLGQTGIFFGIDHVNAGAENRDRFAFCGDGAAMAGRIDTARHATNNDQTLCGEIASQALGHAGAVGRGMARSDHGDARLDQHFRVAAYVKDQRRIVDFFQPRRDIADRPWKAPPRPQPRRGQFLRAPVRRTCRWPATARKPPECRCLRVRSGRRERRLRPIQSARPAFEISSDPGRGSA